MENQSSKDHGLTPAQRSIRARIAAHTSWSRTEDRTERTAPARRAAPARFERLVDPDGVLDEVTRRQRADAQREHTFNAWRCSAPARAAGEPTTDAPHGQQRGSVASQGGLRSRPDLDWHSTDPDQLASCRVICTSCEVREPCLALALANHDPWGLWGGLSPDEREKLAGLRLSESCRLTEQTLDIASTVADAPRVALPTLLMSGTADASRGSGGRSSAHQPKAALLNGVQQHQRSHQTGLRNPICYALTRTGKTPVSTPFEPQILGVKGSQVQILSARRTQKAARLG
ncbi:WhiB family transcriptional regulator [Amycolatopsis sp. lyj-109]|uniref:WhiB family transcriptional regulator n=1 Tax=Amycolatopsis sp. lyj-109 TaxID=2789287 RepID=UPI00397B0FD3